MNDGVVTDMVKIVAIIADGTIRDHRFVGRKLAEAEELCIICADGAARHLRQLNRVPAFIIGDMDSADRATLDYFEKKGSTILKYPVHKDETDTQLALEQACDMLHPDEVWIFGALGGRIDHSLANISLLILGVKRGVRVKIIEEACELFVVTNSAIIDGVAGQTVSLLPLSTEASGITLEGFEYPLSDGVMEIGRPYGISNTLITSRGRISVTSGYLLVIRYFREEE